MDDTITDFPATSYLSVEQALNVALKKGFTSVVIVGESDEGRFMTFSSRMTRKDALWFAEMLRLHAIGMEVP